MIEFFGNHYPYTTQLIKDNITDRLINHAELTVCSKIKKAWINKYKKDPLPISYDLAMVFINIGLVVLDSGNLETGEEHYNFFNR